jgi:hypothetical protein
MAKLLGGFKVLRAAGNVPDGSFEANRNRLWRLGNADSSFEAQQKHCQMAVSNRNSSWGLGKSHGKAAGRF